MYTSYGIEMQNSQVHNKNNAQVDYLRALVLPDLLTILWASEFPLKWEEQKSRSSHSCLLTQVNSHLQSSSASQNKRQVLVNEQELGLTAWASSQAHLLPAEVGEH